MIRRCRRSGQVTGVWLAFLGSVALLIGLVALLAWQPSAGSGSASREPIIVYCAAGMKVPVEAAARDYQEAYGVPVQLSYGGSETLLANAEVSRRGDLYVPADDSYLDSARRKGLLDETLPLAEATAVVAVRQGNPKGISSLNDLLTKDVRIAQANPDAAAVGKVSRDVLRKSGQWEQLKERTTVFKATVNDVAADIKVGSVDAGIVWDATVRQFPELEAVPSPELSTAVGRIGVGVLRSATQPAAALRFARFLAARDRGLVHFEKAGFRPAEGDPWAEEPELRLLSGAMLRPAIDATITAFEKREGVRVTRVYNGCGILVAQMRAGEVPDAFFACDKSFMTQVNDLFLDSLDVSTNQLVILVHKGNPHGLRSLDDLGKPGLRIGVGHEKQCALGVLTQTTLTETGYRDRVMKNVAVQTPTGDMLVNQLRTGSLDAAVAYVSNATGNGDWLDAIKVDVPCAVAVQPMAVGKQSPYKQLTRRLMESLRSAESRHRFEANGFRWQAAMEKP